MKKTMHIETLGNADVIRVSEFDPKLVHPTEGYEIEAIETKNDSKLPNSTLSILRFRDDDWRKDGTGIVLDMNAGQIHNSNGHRYAATVLDIKKEIIEAVEKARKLIAGPVVPFKPNSLDPS